MFEKDENSWKLTGVLLNCKKFRNNTSYVSSNMCWLSPVGGDCNLRSGTTDKRFNLCCLFSVLGCLAFLDKFSSCCEAAICKPPPTKHVVTRPITTHDLLMPRHGLVRHCNAVEEPRLCSNIFSKFNLMLHENRACGDKTQHAQHCFSRNDEGMCFDFGPVFCLFFMIVYCDRRTVKWVWPLSLSKLWCCWFFLNAGPVTLTAWSYISIGHIYGI